ncbi:ABC transporter ATP-binding protein [Alteromonas sp. 5E99-2]|uniref:ABC transporter ATP-binding protein n=1 Tax=Alteromonas sp. 5E99-2 TaxID=2817683 RepID=UPI00325BF8FB
MLSVSKLTYSIDNNPILSDVTMAIPQGKVLGILGPNGAGKTTLLKLLSNQLPSSKSVFWNKTPIEHFQPIELAKHIAVVNQTNDSVKGLSLHRIVSMGLLPHKTLLSQYSSKDDDVVNTALATVGLEDKVHQKFNVLSGGEQQRGLIAQAIVQKAPVMILDEPVNHLDVFYQHQILGLVRSLAMKQKITVVLSLHDFNLAAHYCDSISLMHKGAIAQQGTPDEVLTPPTLESIFKLPCSVTRNPNTHKLQVDFFPPKDAL